MAVNVLEIIGIILGSGVIVALINQIGNRISEKRNRRYAVEDKRDNTQDQIEELRTETSEQFSQIREETAEKFEMVNKKIGAIDEKVDTVSKNTELVMLSTKAQAYDRIRHLGMQYIKAGQISIEELTNLREMHKAYKDLGGNGFLDKIMETVEGLRIKIDE